MLKHFTLKINKRFIKRKKNGKRHKAEALTTKLKRYWNQMILISDNRTLTTKLKRLKLDDINIWQYEQRWKRIFDNKFKSFRRNNDPKWVCV